MTSVANPNPVPMAALMAGLPHVLAAPRDQTTIRQLTFRPGLNLRQHPDRLTLTRADGVPGDRWSTSPWLTLPDGRPDPDIQVSILATRVHDLIRPDPDAALHPGDTILADLDLSEENLPAGTLLKAGTATLRVSDVFNTGCVKWKVRYGKDALTWVTLPGHPPLRLRGVLCAVQTDGEIRTGDLLSVIR